MRRRPARRSRPGAAGARCPPPDTKRAAEAGTGAEVLRYPSVPAGEDRSGKRCGSVPVGCPARCAVEEQLVLPSARLAFRYFAVAGI